MILEIRFSPEFFCRLRTGGLLQLPKFTKIRYYDQNNWQERKASQKLHPNIHTNYVLELFYSTYTDSPHELSIYQRYIACKDSPMYAGLSHDTILACSNKTECVAGITNIFYSICHFVRGEGLFLLISSLGH